MSYKKDIVLSQKEINKINNTKFNNKYIKSSYVSYLKKFKYNQDQGLVIYGAKPVDPEVYNDQYEDIKIAADNRGITVTDGFLESVNTIRTSEAVALRKELNAAKINLQKKGKVTFEFAIEYKGKYDENGKYIRPVATKTQTKELDFTNLGVAEQRKLLQTLSRDQIVPFLLAVGYTRKAAEEFIGY